MDSLSEKMEVGLNAEAKGKPKCYLCGDESHLKPQCPRNKYKYRPKGQPQSSGQAGSGAQANVADDKDGKSGSSSIVLFAANLCGESNLAHHTKLLLDSGALNHFFDCRYAEVYAGCKAAGP